MKLRHLFPTTLLLSVFAITSCAFAQAPKELVVNSGFEQTDDGFVTGWRVSPFLTGYSSVANTGTKSLKIETRDVGGANAIQDIWSFDIGKPHRLQYDVRADRFGVEYRVYIGLWKDARPGDPADTPASAWVGGVDVEPWRQANTPWHHVSSNFTPTPLANKMMVVIEIRGPGAVWFDNVSITPQDPNAVPGVGPVVPPSVAPVAATVVGPRPVEITADRRFLLKGKPFFPLMIWGWTPTSDEAIGLAREWGYNIVGTSLDAPHRVTDIGLYGTRLLLDAAQKHDLQVMAMLNFNFHVNNATPELEERIKATEPLMSLLRDHPVTFGYNINDEPAWAGYDLSAHNKGAQWIKEQDPLHPIFLNHAPRNSIEELKRYNQFIDIAGSDIYPVISGPIVSAPQNHSDLPNKTISVVGDETIKNLAGVDNKKPVIQTLQGFEWAADQSFPTRRQSRFMAWDSVIAGATGIAWFQNGSPRLRRELKPVVREFASLQDVLAAGKPIPTSGLFAAPIKTIAYQWKGRAVVVAINPTEQPLKVTANWKPIFAGKVPVLRVLWEKRQVAASESFQPFDVHVYTDAAEDAEILRPGYEIEDIAP